MKVSDDRIVDVFRRYERERLGPPTLREVGAAVGLQSTHTVLMRVMRLCVDGVLEVVPSTGDDRRSTRYRVVLRDGDPCPTCRVPR